MNTPLETHRQKVIDHYKDSGYNYVLPILQVANSRQLEAFDKLASGLDLSKNTRQRYLDNIQKAKVDSLVRLYEEEIQRKDAKKALGANKHLKRFSR